MATALRTVAQGTDVDRAIERQRELIRRGEITRENGQGGYTVFGKLIHLRYELAEDHPPLPPYLQEIAKIQGLVIDWGNPKTGPLLGKAGNELLIVSKVQALPDIPDLGFAQKTMITWNNNTIPLASIPPDMRQGLKNSDGSLVPGTDQEISRPRMQAQHFRDHARCTVGKYTVFGPIFQGLVKLTGIAHMLVLKFEGINGCQPSFWLDLATGEGFFLGSRVIF